jgi:hypothetical protein
MGLGSSKLLLMSVFRLRAAYEEYSELCSEFKSMSVERDGSFVSARCRSISS